MRWFIEVSTVGSGATDTEYCVEAKQWQAALQQARKLRGESGPLSAFSIELLDSGYRAVDKKQNLKYVVKKAPNDAPLNDGKNGVTSSVAEAHASEDGSADHAREGSSGERSDPNAAEGSAPAHQVASSPRASGPPPRPRLVSSRPPDEGASVVPEKPKTKSSRPAGSAKKAPQKVAELLAAAAQRASARPNPSQGATPSGRVGSPATSNAPRSAASSGVANTTMLVKGSDPSAKAQRSSMASSPALALDPAPHKDPEAEAGAKLDSALGGANGATPDPGSASMPIASGLPQFEVIRSRGEEPSKETPITYREVALGVHPGVTKQATMALLWARYKSVLNEIAERPKGKFVQIAVFDHVFSKKPIRPPLATLMWKDWRGEPALAFPGFSGDSIPPPPPLDEPAPGSLRPISMIPVDETTGSRPPAHNALSHSALADSALQDDREAQARTENGESPNGENTSSPKAQDAPSAPAGPDATSEPAAARTATVATSVQSSASPVERAARGSNGAGVAVEEIVALNKKPTTDPPGSSKRERGHSSDDLIGDLFEKMHELHFMADVVGGSEFVLRVVKQTLPSAFVLIHVFDINTKNFIVVRQFGTNEKVLMFQTPDSDPQLRRVMRFSRTANLAAPDADEQAEAGRWKAGGVDIGPMLAGPVKQGGRYLGLIEIGNPLGAKPFGDVQANALDYICEQFAQFLTNRPIVLDADIILR